MSPITRLFDRLKKTALEIVEYSEPNTPNIGLVGVFGYPLLYLSLQNVFTQRYNGIIWYLIGFVFVLPQVFFRFFPDSLRRIYPVYFFLGGFYSLPFFSFFMFLKNEGSVLWLSVCLGCLMFFIIIFYDWLIVTGMVLAAYGLAILMVVLLDGGISIVPENLQVLPIILISYVGGLVLNHRKMISHESKISLMKSLSGMIAHEMRNPLNAISLAMENIQSTLPARPSTEQNPAQFCLSYDELVGIHDVVSDSISTVSSGNRIIDSILSNLREGDVDKTCFRRYSASEVIRNAIQTYSYRSSTDRQLIFTDFVDEFDFFGDREQFIYVLFNLLNNSLYYSQKQGFRIDITTESTSGGNVIRVRDNGPGIPDAYRKQLFGRFFTYAKKGGNGLGLSFCKRVVESFAGTITCDSLEGCWTEFCITLLPCSSKQVSALKRQILTTKHVLVVDDQAMYRDLYVRYFSDYHCSVDQATDGRQCLEMASSNRYDMILMDIEMPLLSGDETVRLLRSGFNMSPSMMLHYRDAVILGITALPKAEAIGRTLNVGMNEFIPKPLNRDLLMGLFEKYFFNEKHDARADSQVLLAGAHIMVADDNPLIRKILGTILEKEGCRVSHAEQGLQALELLEQGGFDLVLMDMEMPVMDGLEAVRTIRNDERFSRFRDLPIIAITGNADPETIRQVTKVGMNAHIGKPVRKHDLLTTISFWLDYSQNQVPVLRKGLAVQTMQGTASAAGIDRALSDIDPATVESLLGIGGQTLFLQLLDHFRYDMDLQLYKLEAACIEADLVAAHRVCHSIKGAASSIGAVSLSEMARQIDDGLRQERWPSEVGWFGQLKSLYEESCRRLRDCMDFFPDIQQ